MGYLKGGIDSWVNAGKEVDSINQISPEDLAAIYDESHMIDVRKESEYLSEHILGAENFPLAEINDHLSSIPILGNSYIHCAGGYRSMIASSILKLRGYHNIVNILGGFAELKEVDIPKSEFVCPTTL